MRHIAVFNTLSAFSELSLDQFQDEVNEWVTENAIEVVDSHLIAMGDSSMVLLVWYEAGEPPP